MNIEQIAQEVARGMYFEGIGRGTAEYPAEFLRRCLSKLVEQDVGPVGSIRYRVEKTGHGFWPYCVRAGTGTNELFVGHQKQCTKVANALATAFEDGKFVAQQRTAEACAKVCNSRAAQQASETREDEADKCADSIRNGDWREYL